LITVHTGGLRAAESDPLQSGPLPTDREL
jgi:hypothetical protein